MPSGSPFDEPRAAARAATGPAGWPHRLAAHYVTLVLALALLVEVVALLRVREDAMQHTPVLLFALAFGATLLGRVPGLLTAIFLLTVSSSLHLQANTLFGTELEAWAYPGADAAAGFLAGLCLTRDRGTLRLPLARFPSMALLALHGWVALSAVAATARNLWQSGSEFTPRGLWFNTMHLRRLGPLHDYFPLQDLFFVSLAVLLLLAVWGLLLVHGRRLATAIACSILAGAGIDAVFAAWQRVTRGGWYFDTTAFSPNALMPDLHSFAAFMAAALFLALALLAHARREGRSPWPFAFASALFAAALFLSQSRGTVFLVVVLLVALAGSVAFVGRGRQRLAAVASICLLGIAVDVLLTAGYRGLTWQTVAEVLGEFRAETADAALGHRPEIWGAALRMYGEFPLFGLGQGAFYRLSAVAPFSGSAALAEWGGENAHNWFLQTAVQLGPVGIVLMLLAVWPIVRVGRANRHSVALFALAGMAAGNVYGHAWLVAELLLLAAVLLALYYWEAGQLVAGALRPLPVRATRLLCAGVLVLGLLGAAEVAASFKRMPFEFARLCQRVRPLAADGWASGLFVTSLPRDTRVLELELAWDRPDALRRALTVEVRITEADGRLVDERRLAAKEPATVDKLLFTLPRATSEHRLLSVRSSHCYVPFSVGRGYDPRPLGVHVRRLVGG